MALDLGNFDGREVRRTTIAVTNAGDGLSAALKVDPQVLHMGDRVFIALECEVAKVRYEPIDGSDTDVARVHVLRASNATIVDGRLVKDEIQAQVDRIIAARDEELGLQQLSPEAARQVEHDQGLHKRRRQGCPGCYPDLHEEVDHKAGEPDAGDEVAKKRAARKPRAKKETASAPED